MAHRIHEDILEEIRDRLDIVRVVGEYVPLKRAGNAFKGLCPFHKEKTPSFMVNPDRQIFKCFGCGESGNIFTFIMKYESVSFPEAVERMARLAGVLLPEQDGDSEERRGRRHQLYETLAAAQAIFQETLLKRPIAAPARKYLEGRGINSDDARIHGIGYAPDDWEYLSGQLTRKFPAELLVEAGLIIPGKNRPGHYDRLRNRITFPIREHREGRIVAFGGRTLGDDPAKYLNTPDSPVYNKSRVLYGLREALKAIRKNREVIVVEGYFDRISMAKSGFENTVAPCGTSLTDQQVRLLKQAALKAYIIFDADNAGISAAKRALEICLVSGLDALAIPLPSGKDPDDIAREHGAEAIGKLLENGQPGMDFLINMAASQFELNSSRGRRSAVEEMVPFLLEVNNSIDRGVYVSKIAELIRVPPESVIELVRRRSGRPGGRTAQAPQQSADQGIIDPKERDLLLLILHAPELIPVVSRRIPGDWMITDLGRELYASIVTQDATKPVDPAQLVDRLPTETSRKMIVNIVMDPGANARIKQTDSMELMELLVLDFQRHWLKMRLEENTAMIRSLEAAGKDSTEQLKKQQSLAREFRLIREKLQRFQLRQPG